MGKGASKVSTAEATAVNTNVSFSGLLEKNYNTLVYLLVLIAGIKIIELAVALYRSHQRSLKKKYTPDPIKDAP